MSKAQMGEPDAQIPNLDEVIAWLELRLPRADPGRLRRAAEALTKELQKPPRRRGRPHDPVVTRALELRRSGLQWFKIWPIVIPNYQSLDPYERACRTRNLYHAVYNRIHPHSGNGNATLCT